MSSDREQDRLLDVLDNIAAIETYVSGRTLEEFSADRLIVDAVERCLQRITEAVIKIGEARIAMIAPEVPFHALRALGNRLRHDYDMVDHDILFSTIECDLPVLAERCRTAVKQ